ncbi:MAG: hypothetical protein ACREJA_09470 [Candidatus Methylomirabilales bacterium]
MERWRNEPAALLIMLVEIQETWECFPERILEYAASALKVPLVDFFPIREFYDRRLQEYQALQTPDHGGPATDSDGSDFSCVDPNFLLTRNRPIEYIHNLPSDPPHDRVG